MTAVVVDSSVLIAALLDIGPHGVWAEEILAAGTLNAPELIFVEATNILRRMELSRQVTSAEANTAQDDLMRLHLESFPFEPFAERIWELRHAVTSYDAWYVAIAEALGLPLATLDARLSTARGPRCRFLLPS
jgi:predicted nucleic acid-binding protein